ncbi:hypothetical protein TRVL_05297 [Trypanosoma vivax]|nr:hypothetical protein TRVL_05297 [Trypanosoma vivax]
MYAVVNFPLSAFYSPFYCSADTVRCGKEMEKGDVVAVFCDAAHEQAIEALLKPLASFPHKLFAVRNGPNVYRVVGELSASLTSYRCALNLCTGGAEDEDLCCPIVLTSLFEHFEIPYGGCRYAVLKQPLDVLFMMCFYAGLTLPHFEVVGQGTDIHCLKLQFPIKVRSADPFQRRFEVVVWEKSKLQAALHLALKTHRKLVAWEISAVTEKELQVLIWGAGNFSIARQDGDVAYDAWIEQWTPTIKEYAVSFCKNVTNNSGFARLNFNTRQAHGKLVLEDIKLGCSLLELGAHHCSVAAEKGLLDECIRTGESVFTLPVSEVCYGGESKGYFLRAVRDIRAGELVFDDEGKSFVIVTRPFVEKQWSEEDKIVFKEYAWPIDSEGHVYATWDKDPNGWRPINHSCDPNCIFDEDHSLNVVASRDIAKSEELTMDYSTFCDHTMKPFMCFCGSSCCREYIVADETSLKRYGTRTWRRLPQPTASSINTSNNTCVS